MNRLEFADQIGIYNHTSKTWLWTIMRSQITILGNWSWALYPFNFTAKTFWILTTVVWSLYGWEHKTWIIWALDIDKCIVSNCHHEYDDQWSIDSAMTLFYKWNNPYCIGSKNENETMFTHKKHC